MLGSGIFIHAHSSHCLPCMGVNLHSSTRTHPHTLPNHPPCIHTHNIHAPQRLSRRNNPQRFGLALKHADGAHAGGHFDEDGAGLLGLEPIKCGGWCLKGGRVSRLSASSVSNRKTRSLFERRVVSLGFEPEEPWGGGECQWKGRMSCAVCVCSWMCIHHVYIPRRSQPSFHKRVTGGKRVTPPS